MVLCTHLSFSLHGDQLDRWSFLENEVWEVNDWFQILEEEIVVDKRENFLECQSLFSFRLWLISFLSWQCTADTASSAWRTPREQLQTGLPRDLIQVSTAPHNAFATPCNLQISILAHADWRSRTSLISDAATGLASTTTKHNHNNKIKYVTIFQVMDSEATKPSVHFSMSSFKRIILIFHPTCWINLHYWNLNSPDDEWIKFHPKRSSLVAWILNYLYELTLTFIAKNRNQKGSGLEQDSCRTRNQDFVAPAAYHMPIEVVSVRVREHQHQERTPSGVVSETVEQRQECTGEISKSLSQWSLMKDKSCHRAREEWFVYSTSTILQEDCHFVEEFFNFERRSNNDQLQRSSEEEKRETETDSMN